MSWVDLDRFSLPTDASLVVVIGPNGSGKTTLLAREFRRIGSAGAVMITDVKTSDTCPWNHLSAPLRRRVEEFVKLRANARDPARSFPSEPCFYPNPFEGKGFSAGRLRALVAACADVYSGMTLFWDSPEHGIHPELIPLVVEFLRELAMWNIRVVVATNSYDLVQWAGCLFGSRPPDKDGRSVEEYPVYYVGLSRVKDGLPEVAVFSGGVSNHLLRARLTLGDVIEGERHSEDPGPMVLDLKKL